MEGITDKELTLQLAGSYLAQHKGVEMVESRCDGWHDFVYKTDDGHLAFCRAYPAGKEEAASGLEQAAEDAAAWLASHPELAAMPVRYDIVEFREKPAPMIRYRTNVIALAAA